MRILSICTSAGLLDRAFIEAGHEVIAGCEIAEHKRRMYKKWCGGDFITHDLYDLVEIVRGERFDAAIGGPSCQSITKLKAIRAPKFPDLTPGLPPFSAQSLSIHSYLKMWRQLIFLGRWQQG